MLCQTSDWRKSSVRPSSDIFLQRAASVFPFRYHPANQGRQRQRKSWKRDLSAGRTLCPKDTTYRPPRATKKRPLSQPVITGTRRFSFLFKSCSFFAYEQRPSEAQFFCILRRAHIPFMLSFISPYTAVPCQFQQYPAAHSFSSSADALAANLFPASTSAPLISAARAEASVPMPLLPDVANRTIFLPVKS